MGSSRAYMYVCLSLRISIFVSICPVVRVTFCRSKRAAHNYVQRMWPQAMGSNPLSGSIICPSVHPSIHPSIQSSAGLLRFLYLYINSQCGGPAPRCIFFEIICLSLCPVVRVSFWLSFVWTFEFKLTEVITFYFILINHRKINYFF